MSAELVKRAKAGDRQAYEALYMENYKAVYYTCISFLKNRDNAEDVVQDAFLVGMMKLASLEDEERFTPWIQRIAVNKCRDFLKKSQPIYVEDEELEEALHEENEQFLSEDYVLEAEKRKLIMDIMKRELSEIQYQTVIMYYYDEMKVSEISEEMGCAEGTVMTRLSLARGKIKKAVEEYEKKHHDKLYVLMAVPFLAYLLHTEAEAATLDLEIPPMRTLEVAPTTKMNTEGKKQMKLLETTAGKIGVGVLTVAVTLGVMTAGVVIAGHWSGKNGSGAVTTSQQQTEQTELVASVDGTETTETTIEVVTSEVTTYATTEATTEAATEETTIAETEAELFAGVAPAEGLDEINGTITIVKAAPDGTLYLLTSERMVYTYNADGLQYYGQSTIRGKNIAFIGDAVLVTEKESLTFGSNRCSYIDPAGDSFTIPLDHIDRVISITRNNEDIEHPVKVAHITNFQLNVSLYKVNNLGHTAYEVETELPAAFTINGAYYELFEGEMLSAGNGYLLADKGMAFLATGEPTYDGTQWVVPTVDATCYYTPQYVISRCNGYDATYRRYEEAYLTIETNVASGKATSYTDKFRAEILLMEGVEQANIRNAVLADEQKVYLLVDDTWYSVDAEHYGSGEWTKEEQMSAHQEALDFANVVAYGTTIYVLGADHQMYELAEI